MIRKYVVMPSLLIAILFLYSLIAYSSDGFISIKGIVKDSLGNVLSGADIFISSDDFNTKIFNTKTDEKGQYILEKIVAGVYKVAAAKRGYLTSMEDINAQAESSVDLTLKPITNNGSALDRSAFPDALDWIRRIPKKDILKEIDRVSAVQNDDSGQSDPQTQQALTRTFSFSNLDTLPLRIALRQVTSKDISGDEGGDSNEKKNSMGLSLAGNIGSDCEVEMDGLKKRWNESQDESIAPSSIKRDSELIGVSGRYNFGDWGTLGFETFYGTDDLDIKNQLASSGLRAGNQKEWGYSAGWKKKISQDTAFDIEIAHSGQEFKGDPLVTASDESTERLSVYNQAINASGSFQTRLVGSHVIDIGISTHFFSNSNPLFHILSQRGDQSFYGSGEMSRHLSLYGKDSWTIFDPVTISLGFNYYNFYYDRPLQAITPVLEVEYRSGSGISLKTAVSYIIDTGRGGQGDRSETAFSYALSEAEAQREVACKVDLRKELKDGSSITTRFSYTPLLILDAEDEILDLTWNDISLYMTDGNASSKKAGTFIEKKFRYLDGGFGLDYGEIKGTFSSLLPDDLPLQVFREGSLNYLLAAIRAYSSESDTEFMVRFRRIKDSIDGENIGGNSVPLTYSMVSIQIGQGVPILRIRGLNLKAIVEYDDILAYDDLGSDPIKSLLLPVRRIGGGFIVTF